RALGRDEHLLGRMAMQRGAVSLRRVAHIGDGEAVRRRGDLRLQIRIVEVLDDTHADDVDDLALIAGDALIEEGECRTFHRGEPRDMAALHLFRGHFRGRLAAQPGIDISHGTPPRPLSQTRGLADAYNARITSASASRHGRGLIPNTSATRRQSSTELAGRRAGVGYSAVVIASTFGGMPRQGAANSKIASAKPCQLTVPAPAKW